VVALRVLALGEEALRNHEVQIVPGARHRDIEEAPLLLDLGRGAGTEVRRDASIDDVQDEDRFPFPALGPSRAASTRSTPDWRENSTAPRRER
jgi:hypothetical protein